VLPLAFGVLSTLTTRQGIISGMSHLAAFDDTRLIATSGMRAGAPAPGANLVPDGQAHALSNDSSGTLCGLGLDDVTPFPGLTFEATNADRRCEACAANL
jgi:hypothetical protein